MSNEMVDVSVYNRKRPLKEGEVFKAGHVVRCGITLGYESELNKTIYAYVLQSFSTNACPHLVYILHHKNLTKWKCSCTCKAGAGGICKHIVAVLLFVNRNEVDILTCIGMEQQWGKDSCKMIQEQYKKPIHVREYCHVTDLRLGQIITSEEVDRRNFKILQQHDPNAVLGKLKTGQTQENVKNISVTSYTTTSMQTSGEYVSADDIYSKVTANNVVKSFKFEIQVTKFYQKYVVRDGESVQRYLYTDSGTR